MTVWKAVLLLGLYIAYVAVVLAADVAHRWGWVPSPEPACTCPPTPCTSACCASPLELAGLQSQNPGTCKG